MHAKPRDSTQSRAVHGSPAFPDSGSITPIGHAVQPHGAQCPLMAPIKFRFAEE